MAKKTKTERRRRKAQQRDAQAEYEHILQQKQEEREIAAAVAERQKQVVDVAKVAAAVLLFISPVLGLDLTVNIFILIIIVAAACHVLAGFDLGPGSRQHQGNSEYQEYTPQYNSYSSSTTTSNCWTARAGSETFFYKPIGGLNKDQWAEAVDAAADRYRQQFIRTQESWDKLLNEAIREVLMRDFIHDYYDKHAKQQQEWEGQQQWQRQEQQKWQRQKQQQWQEPRDNRQQQQWAAAAATLPDVTKMTARGLLEFLQQLGVDTPRPPLEAAELLSLAENSLPLWECKRILTCEDLRSKASTHSVKVRAALCVFRVQCNNGKDPVAVAKQPSVVQAVEKEYKCLARKVHPDKLGRIAGKQQHVDLSNEASKALNLARNLLRQVASGVV